MLRLLFLTALFAVCPATASRAQIPDDYWQQEVNYVMDVTLQPDLRTIDGAIKIEYINNSPDTLSVIYLKAFPNAIQNGSYADHKRRSYNDWTLADLESKHEGSLTLREADDGEVNYDSFDVDNTIAAVYLTESLRPGDTVTLSFGFTTVLPKPHAMRMGLRGGTIKAVYWYPQACVYDRKMGWVNSQYLGWGECYGDFGDFDVTITAPADHIVAATGVCVNEDEMLSSELREKLDIRHYIETDSADWPRIEFNTSETKTWHYVAENVNDFAWTASDRWCIDADTVNGVEVVAYPLKHKAEQWVSAVTYGKQTIETLSELYYPYQWPVMRICDAFSGMEYPMLTNCGGGDFKSHFALLVYHEIAHQWFMGQVGSNQVDRPFLDEGFATHAEHNLMEKYLGREGNWETVEINWFYDQFAPKQEDRNKRGFRPLFLLMRQELDQPIIYTSYDQGKEYWPWRVSAYYKTAAMHYSLRSIFGDSTYFDIMHEYCDRWFFKHPYEEDFMQVWENETDVQMEMYLNQWYYSRDWLDYAFDGVDTDKRERGYRHTVKLKREGEFVSPIDVAVIWQQGDTTFYTVPPEGMDYTKPGYVLQPTWHQFRRGEDEYEFTIDAARKIAEVVVDPYELLMDINRMNNSSGLIPPVELRFDNLVYDYTPVNKYKLRWRPDLWYNDPNGVELGGHLHGSYHNELKKFSLDLRYGTDAGNVFVDLSYSHPVAGLPHSANRYRYLTDGERMFLSTAFEKKFKDWYSRPDHEWLGFRIDYLNFVDEQRNRFEPLPENLRKFISQPTWDAAETWYALLSDGFVRTFRYGQWYFYNEDAVGAYKEDDRHRAFLESRFLLGVELTSDTLPWFTLDLQYFTTGGTPPQQYLYHLSRARSIDRFTRSDIFRTAGTVPGDWEDDFYLDGGRVRGYQDRILYLIDFGGGSLELAPPGVQAFGWAKKAPLIGKWLAGVQPAVFLDAGAVNFDDKEVYYPEPIASNETLLDDSDWDFFMSAGLTINTPPVWRGNSLRFDFPLYLNEPAPGEEEFDFRFSVVWQIPNGF